LVKKIALLKAIQAQKSISRAARPLKMSRLRALQWVQAISNALCAPAVATKVGGRNCGGAILTPIRTQIVDRYRATEASAQWPQLQSPAPSGHWPWTVAKNRHCGRYATQSADD
jgi:molybdate transport repressor ModE-like protein